VVESLSGRERIANLALDLAAAPDGGEDESDQQSKPSRITLRRLLYRVFMRLQDEFAERAMSLELDIAPEVDHAVVDRLKLREVLPGLAVQRPQRAARARRQAGAGRPDL
jgi:hypothetical protein